MTSRQAVQQIVVLALDILTTLRDVAAQVTAAAMEEEPQPRDGASRGTESSLGARPCNAASQILTDSALGTRPQSGASHGTESSLGARPRNAASKKATGPGEDSWPEDVASQADCARQLLWQLKLAVAEAERCADLSAIAKKLEQIVPNDDN